MMKKAASSPVLLDAGKSNSGDSDGVKGQGRPSTSNGTFMRRNSSDGVNVKRQGRPSTLSPMRIHITIPKTLSQDRLPAGMTPRNNSNNNNSTNNSTFRTKTTSTRLPSSSSSSSSTTTSRPATTTTTTSVPASVTIARGHKKKSQKVSPTPPARKSFAPARTETTATAVETPYYKWPQESSTALPPLAPHLWQGLEQKTLKFPINEDCTALKLTPTGRLLIGGFSDGTVRLFDLTGTYNGYNSKNKNSSKKSSRAAADAVDAGSGSGSIQNPTSSSQPQTQTQSTTTAPSLDEQQLQRSQSSQKLVCSKHFQRFGAVACQIHAKGVHTSLLMDVDVSEDGLWCFAGVLRGSMELVAVHLGHLETSFQNNNNTINTVQDTTDTDSSGSTQVSTPQSNINTNTNTDTNLLDHVTVFRHAHAKLRGFGSCTRLKHTKHPKYLLFTGKAIKNIHIWSFEPPLESDVHVNAQPVWQQLYDTQTNGNTIKLLQFRYNGAGDLLGVSKSDGQKLRVWDLSHEQKSIGVSSATNTTDEEQITQTRPNRPPFQDVTNTESTLGVAGGFCLNGGSELYNQMSIVSLDVENLQSLYNHTELALPGLSDSSHNNSSAMQGSRRRQQRGDLKSIVSVAGMALDAGQVLLELSNGSILQYTTATTTSGLPKLTVWEEAGPLSESVNRKLCVGRIGSVGVAVAALATYDPSRGRGRIVIRALDPLLSSSSSSSSSETSCHSKPGFWGFLGPPTLRNPVPTPDKTLQTVPEIQALTETIHPITTAKKPKNNDITNNDNDNVSLPQPMAETAKKAPLQAQARKPLVTPKILGTAKKAPLQTQTRKPLVTPKSLGQGSSSLAQQSTLPLARRLETTTPLGPSRVSLDKSFMKKADALPLAVTATATADAAADDVTEKRPSAKYLKTTHGVKKSTLAVIATDSTKRKPLIAGKKHALTKEIALKPVGLPRVSLDGSFMKKADELPMTATATATAMRPVAVTATSDAADDDATEKRPPAKYLKTTHGVKKSSLAAIPTEATKRKPLLVGKKHALTEEIVLEPWLQQQEPHPIERSPPVPRKQLDASDDKETAEPLMDVAAALFSLSSTSPMVAIPAPSIATGSTVQRVVTKASTTAKAAIPAPSIATGSTVQRVVTKASTTAKAVIPAPRIAADSTVQRVVTKAFFTSTKSPMRSHVRKDSEGAKKRIVHECIVQQARILTLLDQIPKSNGGSRVKLSATVTRNLEEVHVLARGKLAAQHRAAHEMMQKKVLRATLGIIQSLKRSPSVGAVVESKTCLEGMVQSYQEIVEEMIWRQQMEASSLAAQQTFENQGVPAPDLLVSFTFPCVFQQALDCAPKLN